MEQVVIENPIINSPFEEPERHFRFTEDGITNEISDARRVSSYFIPVPKPKKKSKQQLTFATCLLGTLLGTPEQPTRLQSSW